MQIDLSPAQYERLSVRALAAGYSDVGAFIAALADEPTQDPRGPLNEAELRESAAKCDQSLAEMNAGQSHDFRQAMLEIGRQRGYPRL